MLYSAPTTPLMLLPHSCERARSGTTYAHPKKLDINVISQKRTARLHPAECPLKGMHPQALSQLHHLRPPPRTCSLQKV